MIKVSVLIPTLNSIDFMKTCLESVMNQTMEALEILVIDAGSTDGTLELVKEYQKQDARIRLLYSDRRSYGYQLNMGIAAAAGNYIGVVESDDLIEKNMYEALFAVAEETDADYVKGSYYNYALTKDGKEMIVPEQGLPKNLLGSAIRPADYKSLYLEDIYLWNGIYKKEFLRKNNIRFHESAGAAYQDVGFLYQIYTIAQKAVYLDSIFYKYRRNNSNSSTYSEKAFAYLAGEYRHILSELKVDMEPDDTWSTYFYCRLFRQCISRFRLLAYNNGDAQAVREDIYYLQNLLKEAYRSKKIDLSIWDTHYQMEFFMFIGDIDSYINYYQLQISGKKQFLNYMIENMKRFSKTILVSNSKVQGFVYALLNTRGIDNIMYLCDNDISKWGLKRMGLEIVSVEKACDNGEDGAYVIANPRARNELKQQLNSLGIRDEQIFVFDLGYDWLFLA